MRGVLWAATAVAVSWLAPCAVLAQTSDISEIARADRPPSLDGSPTMEEWEAASVLPTTMYAPSFGGQPADSTVIRVMYDASAIYLGGWFYAEPSDIRIHSLQRDRWSGDDAFAIYIDAFNDNSNSKWFGVTPAGTRFDQLVSDDGATLNGNWDGFWDAATSVTEEGWFAEVRIPLSTLGVRPGSDGDAVIGLTVTRRASKRGERVTFPAIDPAFAFRQPSVAADVRLRDVRGRRALWVSPFVAADATRNWTLAESGPHAVSEDQHASIGGDVKWSLGNGLVLDVAINPDFAQAEADDQQVNLDRFPLFFPEKRRFFQESSGLFDFQTGDGGRLFHSRRIGLSDDGVPIQVDGGIRLTGRLDAVEVGVLSMQTDAGGGGGSENFSVLRLRSRVFNDYSTAGVILSSRLGGASDRVDLGLDASIRLRGDDYLVARAATSLGDDMAGASAGDRSTVSATLERRVQRGWAYRVDGVYQGGDFDPAAGFVRRRDFAGGGAELRHVFRPDDNPRIQSWYPRIAYTAFHRNDGGGVQSSLAEAGIYWQTVEGGTGNLRLRRVEEGVLTPFRVGGALIGEGEYREVEFAARFAAPFGHALRGVFNVGGGGYFGGSRLFVDLAPTWTASRHLELGIRWNASRLRLAERVRSLNLLQLRSRIALNAHASVDLLGQYNSTRRRLDLNLRGRYNFSEGTDLWIVLDGGARTDLLDPRFDEPLPRSTGSALIVKFTRTIGM